MSVAPACSCLGAPRDLGLDQGRVWAREVAAAVATLPLAVRLAARLPIAARGWRLRRVERDLGRYFPHMDERLTGLARGAHVTRAELCALLAAERRDAPEREAAASPGLLVAVSPERTGAGALLGRCVEWGAASRRESAPESDYRSEEVVLPWLVPALCGVNEHGLAVAGASLPPEPGTFERCAAPALLLVQDCLQRFDAAEKAIEWCQSRPAGGCASILLADRTGRVAEVVVTGAERRVRRPEDGVLVGAGAGGRGEALAKAIRERPPSAPPLDAGALHELLASHPGARPHARSAVADPRSAALSLA